MIVKQYATRVAFDRTVQDMEFVAFKHMLFCIDKTNFSFHYLYRYEKPMDYFLADLEVKKHKIMCKTDLDLKLDESNFNDLCFSLYECDSAYVAVFDGLMIIAKESGLWVHVQDALSAREIPPVDALEAYSVHECLDEDNRYEQYLIPVGNLHDRMVSSEDGILEVALKIEEISYIIYDSIRAPGEYCEENERLEFIEDLCKDLRGYNSIMRSMSIIMADILDLNDDLPDGLEKAFDKVLCSLGLNRSLFDINKSDDMD